MWSALTQGMAALIVMVILAAAIAFSTRPSAAERARLWQQIAAEQMAQSVHAGLPAAPLPNWAHFQQEALAELALAPQLPPAPAGGISPGSAVPPLYLYHGTCRRKLASVFARGIEGRSAGWAFATPDYGTAQTYGRSHAGNAGYVVLRIHAQRAFQNGVHFETRGGYYVAKSFHPAFLDFHWTLADLAHREGGSE